MIITLQQYIDDTTTEFAKSISKYTVQLYEMAETTKKFKSPYEAIATSILLKYNDKCFLITAGHVISDHNLYRLGIFEGNTFYRLTNEGQKVFYINPDISKKHESYDIAIWELDIETIELLRKYYDFLSPDNLLLYNDYSPLLRYIIVAFPSTRTKLNPIKNKLKVKTYKFLTTIVSKSIYTNLKINPDINIAVEYNQREIRDMKTGILKRSIQLQGISGCGLWYIPELYHNPNTFNNFFLAGLVFRHDKNKKYLISLKSKVITEIIKERFK